MLIGTSQAVLAVTLLAVAWAASSSSLWPLMLTLLPAGFFSGLLVPAMTSQAIAAVEPALHGAASGAFNTSRQVGGAIGIATFGAMLGSPHNLTNAFSTCVLVTAAATGLTLVLTVTLQVLARRSHHRRAAPCTRSEQPRGRFLVVCSVRTDRGTTAVPIRRFTATGRREEDAGGRPYGGFSAPRLRCRWSNARIRPSCRLLVAL